MSLLVPPWMTGEALCAVFSTAGPTVPVARVALAFIPVLVIAIGTGFNTGCIEKIPFFWTGEALIFSRACTIQTRPMTRLACLDMSIVVLHGGAVVGRGTEASLDHQQALCTGEAGSGGRASLTRPVTGLTVFSFFFIISAFWAVSNAFAIVQH